MARLHYTLFVVALAATAPLALHACVVCRYPQIEPALLDVEVSIASVTLAEDCPQEQNLVAGRPAEDCDGESCGGWCQQSGVTLAIDAGEGDTAVPFEVVAVRLHAMDDGALVDTLEARNPRVFVGDEYVAWDEQIAPGAQLRVTYDTSAPDWAAIGGQDTSVTFGRMFRLVMVVRVDGVERTLEFAPVSREPQIVT